MVSLEESIHKDLKVVIDKIITCENADEYDSLLGIYELLNNVAVANNIDEVRYTDVYKKYQQFNIDYIVDKLNGKTISNYERYYKFNKRFINLTYDLKEDYNNNKFVPSYEEMDDIDIVNIALDLFKNYDNDIYAFLKEYVSYNKVFLVDRLIDAISGCIVDTDDFIIPYVFIEKTNDICELITLIHEFIHIYFQNIEKHYTYAQQINRNLNNFKEVYSSFIELIALDYLKCNNFNKKDIYSYKVDYDNDMIEDLALFSHYLNNKRVKIKDLELVINVEQYSYGKVLAYHFYNQYLENKNMAKENLHNFVLDCKDKNKKHLLNNYGLNQSDVYSSKTLKKYIY